MATAVLKGRNARIAIFVILFTLSFLAWKRPICVSFNRPPALPAMLLNEDRQAFQFPLISGQSDSAKLAYATLLPVEITDGNRVGALIEVKRKILWIMNL